jgi:cysteine desulfurase
LIYLDNNASTPVDPAVAALMASVLSTVFANPSSTHCAGTVAKGVIESARAQVASLLDVRPEEIIFTSGGTESNNLAIIGAARARDRGHIITSAIEHPAVLNPCAYLARQGYSVTSVGVDEQGVVRPEEIADAIKDDTFLVSVMHANNETGVLQPVADIGRLARSRGILFHTDAAQTIGKIPVTAGELAADMISVAAHKFYGPKGVGALYLRRGVALLPTMFGAGHERGLRPGTENTAGIAGLGLACELAQASTAERAEKAGLLTALLYRLLAELIPGVKWNGGSTARLPNTLNVVLPGIDAADLLGRIGERLAASAGSACHAGMRKPSAVLTAMGVSEADALSSIRFSVGKDTTAEEITAAVSTLARALQDREP